MKILLLGFFLLVAFNPNAKEADSTEQRIRSLEEKLRCLVCQNQSLADSPAELAVDLRRQVREQVKAGRADQQILDFMVQRYGDFVLYEPPLKASTLLLWIGPFALLAAAFAVLLAVLRRRRGAPDEPALGAEERGLVERVLNRDGEAG